jgi:hypothetical protein
MYASGWATLAPAIAALVALVAVSSADALREVNTGPETTLAVSTNGSDKNACTAIAPCGTLNRVYRAAVPGQTVEIAAGSYPGQVIKPDPSKTSNEDVVFRPAPGASVTFTGELTIQASHLEIRDVTIAGNNWHVKQGADDVTMRNVRASKIFITSASNIRVLGGEVGPTENSDPQIKTASETAPVPTNILLDRVYFHDIIRTNPSAHTECLQIMAGNGIVIRNSRFERCATHDILIHPFLTDRIRNLLIENNWFAATIEGFYSLRVGDCENALIRNNSATQNMINPPTASCNARWYGNIMPSKRTDQCGQGVGATWDYNVYGEGSKCGANDLVGPSAFVSESDFHLARGAGAIGRANPDSYPALDYDGQQRPSGAPPDAGADQREPVAIVLGKSIGAARLGMPRAEIVAFYGDGRNTTVRRMGMRLERSRYGVVGGRLTITYDKDGRVVIVSTTSPYYRTKQGIAVGTPAPTAAFAWSPCAKSHIRARGGTTTDIVPTRGRKGAQIAAISVAMNNFRVCGSL